MQRGWRNPAKKVSLEKRRDFNLKLWHILKKSEWALKEEHSHRPQCWNSTIFLPIRFYVKSIVELHTVEKSSKTRSPLLRKKHNFFRQINIFTKEVTKELISRKFFSVNAFYCIFPQYTVTLWPNSPKSPQIRKIQLLNIKKSLVWFQSIYIRTSKFQIIRHLNIVDH